jgi:hypothetical protein
MRKDGSQHEPEEEVVKVRGPKKLGPTDTLASVLQSKTAFQVIDQGPAT